MKKIKAILLAMIIFLLPTLTACEQEEELPYVVLSKANVTLSVGDEYTLSATVCPASKSDLPLEWRTSNPEIVSCEGGRLKAKAVGTAVIMASVKGGNAFSAIVNVTDTAIKHINMILGNTMTIPEHEYKYIFAGEFAWSSSNPSVAGCVDGVITAAAKGDAVISVSKGLDAVTLYTVSVFEGFEDIVDCTAPELPVTLPYISGLTTAEVIDVKYTITGDDTLNTDRLLVTLDITYKKAADQDGDQATNRTGFLIELYSDEVGYCATYRAESSGLVVGETATFSTQFYAGISNGMRHFNIKLIPIEY